MSAQTDSFNKAQARISDLVRHNEEQAKIIAGMDASVDPVVAPIGSDPEFEALLNDEQAIHDEKQSIKDEKLHEACEELAKVILDADPTLVGNDPR